MLKLNDNKTELIVFTSKYKQHLLSLSSCRTTDNVIEKAVMKFHMKSNEVISNFKLLPCYIKSKLFTTFCTDVSYGILNQEKFMSHGEK